MAENTKIQWCDHSVNFWTGCIKVSSGCKFCYMYRDQERYGKDPKEVLKVKQTTINNTLKAAKSGDKIFTNSWSDFFIKEADEWREWAWDIIRSTPDLNWLILTKRPERIMEHLPKDWNDGWDNVWLGISVEDQESANIRMPILADVPCKTRFLSVEPILAEVNIELPLYSINYETIPDDMYNFGTPPPDEPAYFYYHWIIVGGESGNNTGKYLYRPSSIEWYNNIVNFCKENNIPVFVKQLGTHLSKHFGLKDRHGGNIDEFPENLKIREFPKTKNNRL